MIRDYRPSDRARCADILTRAMAHAFHWTDVAAVTPEDFDEFTSGEVIRVAETDGEVRGLSSVWADDCFLHHLYVSPEAHRQGIGRALLADALQACDGRLSLKCQMQNTPARAFYRAMGFVETDEPGGSEGPLGPWLWMRTPAAIDARGSDA